MPKSYEDEIRDLLRGMERFPGEGRRPKRPRWRLPAFRGLGPIDVQRLIGGALILMLFAWILRGPWAYGYPALVRVAGYLSLVSIVLFVVGLILALRAGSFGGYGGYGREVRWRGQVIELPRRGPLSSLRSWFRRTFSRRSGSGNGYRRRPGRGGRDTLPW
jgi:hypothetical protein